MSDIDVRFEDHSDEVLDALDDGMIRALEAIGLQCENYAKRKCPVDTGLLRNSITHVVSGGELSGTYHSSYGSNRYKSGKNKGKRYSATSKNAGTVGYGTISGSIGTKGEAAVYIGSNVQYGSAVENGYVTKKGKHVAPRPYLKPAAMDHLSEYKRLAEDAIKGFMD